MIDIRLQTVVIQVDMLTFVACMFQVLAGICQPGFRTQAQRIREVGKKTGKLLVIFGLTLVC